MIDAGTRAAMQGRHQTGLRQHDACGVAERAGVTRSSVGPNTAVTRTPSAAARCMAPESFDTSARQFTSTPASVGMSVPTRSRMTCRGR